MYEGKENGRDATKLGAWGLRFQQTETLQVN